jgi:phosphohistidine phosphatase SixA
LLAMMLTGGRGRGRDGAAAEAPPPEDPAARQKAAVEKLTHAATLSLKGHDPEIADLVRQANGNQTLIFGFPKQALAIAATDKDAQFTMKLGTLTIKAKFEPKEMMYKGELSV